jgi:hypothetical protein
MPGQHVAPAVLRRRKKIGKRLRKIRKEMGPRGMWRRELKIEAWLGVRPETWFGYERGSAIPGDIILRLIVELGISPRWLLTGQGTVRPDGDKLELPSGG